MAAQRRGDDGEAVDREEGGCGEQADQECENEPIREGEFGDGDHRLSMGRRRTGAAGRYQGVCPQQAS